MVEKECLKVEIDYHEEVLKKPKGWHSFEHFVLVEKVAHGKYVRLQDECGKLENELDTIMQSSSVGEVEAEKEVRRLTFFAAGRDAAGKMPPREWEAMTWCQRLAHIKKELHELLLKTRLQAEKHKWDSTGNLKRYVRSQVHPDLLACHGLIWLATAHHVCACSL